MPPAASTAIVFICDQNYIFLASQLVRSLNANVRPHHTFDLVCIDTGLQAEGQVALTALGVRIVPADRSLLPPVFDQFIAVRPKLLSQIIRPWIPAMLPDCDTIIYMDSDTWAQNDEFYRVFHDVLAEQPGKVALAYNISHYSVRFLQHIQTIWEIQHWFSYGLFEQRFQKEFAKMAFFSSGIFAMRRDCPVWKLWADEIARIYPLALQTNNDLYHMHEQTALNAVVQINNAHVVVDAIYNFHCNERGAHRSPKTGKVTTSLVLPEREISVVHLATWKNMEAEYRADRLLFEES